ncbi:ROK family transcriptional regulator [Sagittula sp. SSi028]|uniref:ROK family transcriptional regulator n=1 Tax=Sagittula sp. SSi028 TaxID=3400636 RepID=UPI003AF6C943
MTSRFLAGHDGRPTATSAEHTRGSNQSGMRAHNERLVLTLIRQHGPLAKAEISRMTGLSAQTISVIMRALEAEGLLIKGAPVRGKVGQPSVPLGLNPQGAYFLGLHVERRSIALCLTDFTGAVIQRRQARYDYPTPDGVIAFANDAITDVLDGLDRGQRARVAGLGIAIPFQLQDWAEPLGVAPEKMADWAHREIDAELAAHWDMPVYLRNDASAACGAELVFGDQTRPRDFLYIFIGFFIGAGMVLDDALYTGLSGNAAALGSLPVGASMQLVDVASLATLDRMRRDAGGQGGLPWDQPEDWDISPDILDDWIDGAAEGIARAITMTCCVIDFDTVLIDGQMAQQVRTRLVQEVTDRIKRHPLAGITSPQIRPGTVGPQAPALGAASLPLSDRFLVDRSAAQSAKPTGDLG